MSDENIFENFDMDEIKYKFYRYDLEPETIRQRELR